VVTFDGFPLGYEVFAGDSHHSRTLQTIVTTMETPEGQPKLDPKTRLSKTDTLVRPKVR
jgi:hypothetical protein